MIDNVVRHLFFMPCCIRWWWNKRETVGKKRAGGEQEDRRVLSGAGGGRKGESLTRGRWSSGLPLPRRLQPSACRSLAPGQNLQMSAWSPRQRRGHQRDKWGKQMLKYSLNQMQRRDLFPSVTPFSSVHQSIIHQVFFFISVHQTSSCIHCSSFFILFFLLLELFSPLNLILCDLTARYWYFASVSVYCVCWLWTVSH